MTKLVVLMLENRSFDNMLGFAYSRSDPPNATLLNPEGKFYGRDFALDGTGPSSGYSNPSSHGLVRICPSTDFTMPHPDPGEHFDRITAQIFGPGREAIPANNEMSGFLPDFAQGTGTVGIMRYYTPVQVPVITTLARRYAVCDRWFASSPTQTLPTVLLYMLGHPTEK